MVTDRRRVLVFAFAIGLAGCGLIAQLRDIELAPDDDSGTATDGSIDNAAEDRSIDGGVPDCVPDGTACCPPGNTLSVAPTGNDTSGNGSATCPFKTITAALAHVGTTVSAIRIANGTYGEACTGGAPCDATPITINATAPLDLRGETTANVIVQGAGRAVFVVNASRAGFDKLTIKPFLGHGIVYEAPIGAASPIVQNVHVEVASAASFDAGLDAAAADAGPGSGIVVGGGVSPQIGPGVIVSGGYLGIDVGGTSAPVIGGTLAAPTIVNGSGPTYGCVRVKSNDLAPASVKITNLTGGADAGVAVTLTNCTPNLEVDTQVAGTGSTLEWTQMTWPNGGGFTPALLATRAAKLAFKSSTMNGSVYYGMRINGTANVAIEDVTAIGNYYPVVIAGSANVDIRRYTLKSTIYGSIDCSATATVKVRESTIVANQRSGVSISGSCNADLGTASDPGKNIFNLTSQKNVWSGVCFTSTVAPIAAAGNTWSCNHAGGTCITGTPTFAGNAGGFTCQTGTDIASPSATNVQALTPTCCN